VRLHSGVHQERALYVGVTSNLPARIHQHREGLLPGFTERYGVKRLVYHEGADSMEAAIAREKTVKRWPREWKCNLIERENPYWEDLAVGLGFPVLPTRS